ncbi:MAG: tRNA lysidine(34) synthetase TilS, partial [Flavobacteriales bacterium]|nr:tRNA lysidine(34) synthetase TilS [Flavobacteriales bacterium]
MKNKVQNYILLKSLFLKEDKLVLGISGGADSVCLMHILLSLNYDFELAHCNFNLRGKESEEDESFVKELAEKYQLKIHLKQFDTEGYATENKISTQMAARDLRYAWFNDLLLTQNANHIAIAHHANDDVETFFINLIRGSGIKGLLGISEKTNSIVRPLMAVSRTEIENYLDENKLSYRNDSSNASVKYLRNKIRHELMPLLTEMNPSIQQTIVEQMKVLEGVSKVYNQKIKEVKEEIVEQKEGTIKLSIAHLLLLNPLNTYLYELLSPYGFTTIDAIAKSLKGQSGKQFFSNTHSLLVDREFVFISKLYVEKNELIAIEEKTKEIKSPLQLNFSETATIDWIKDIN